MKNLKVIFSIGLLALLISCSKKSNPTPDPVKPPIVVPPDPVRTRDVYVAGWDYSNKMYSVATLWKNGTATALTDGTADRAEAYSVYVSGTDVYVAGIDGGKCVIWKNGAPTVLATDLYSSVYSVFVNGTDVYVSGFSHGLATIWKNGVAVRLTSGPEFSRAYAIYVNGGDVYAAGYEYNKEQKCVAMMWKNGIATQLSDGTRQATAKSIAVSGNDVYVAGTENVDPADRDLAGNESSSVIPLPRSIARIWKNGVIANLTTGDKQAVANSVFVNGADVFVAGYEYDGSTSRAILWKNMKPAGLNAPTEGGVRKSSANSVFVHNGDVYVAGNSGVTARTWVNIIDPGSLVLGKGGAVANAVFVKQL
ncbi:hypothetical protein TH53_20365 [Pedobacter lusitanus]|uniref:Contig98, whole genome shotgun sequence n=1 Tax=Pedobacter lusitanus TaxID=1503925 RepID=A0A0D0GHB6_9SPHI|nr:hypothetical protein [Pedobacter lusitanus]KIO75515.1 hypothetical protein TH53_20365 [Pedobacter lusitanus]